MSLLGQKPRFVLGPLLMSLGLLVLFFYVTDPTSWPQLTSHLSASDMKAAPRVSTVWCESVVLIADHRFVSYNVPNPPLISTKFTRNTMDMEIDLDQRKLGVVELKYFLLKGSIVRVQACGSRPGARVSVYRGTVNRRCLHSNSKEQDSSEYDSDESDDFIEILTSGEYNDSMELATKPHCPSPIRSSEIPVAYTEGVLCTQVLPVRVNIVESDNYVVLFASDREESNRVKLRLSLDRTTYNVNESRRSFHACSAGSLCVVPVTFASQDRVILWIPAEPSSGRTQFSIHARCRPRIEFFAVLTILLPIALMFSVICVVLKRRKAKVQNPFLGYGAPYEDRSSPLLVGFREIQTEGDDTDETEASADQRDSEPPSYEMICPETPPPDYRSLKLG